MRRLYGWIPIAMLALMGTLSYFALQREGPNRLTAPLLTVGIALGTALGFWLYYGVRRTRGQGRNGGVTIAAVVVFVLLSILVPPLFWRESLSESLGLALLTGEILAMGYTVCFLMAAYGVKPGQKPEPLDLDATVRRPLLKRGESK